MYYSYTVGPAALIALLALLAATLCGNEATSANITTVTTIARPVEPTVEASPVAVTASSSPPPTWRGPGPASSPNIDAARPTLPMDKLASAGARLHIRCVGPGPRTVLVISGFTIDGDSWGAVEAQLCDCARVCSYARFGTGSGTAAPTDQTFATQADDLANLLATTGVPGPYIVVGRSF